MPAAADFDLDDPTARLIAADAEQEAGREANAYLLRNLELSGSGKAVLEGGRTREATARRALGLLRAPDWNGFARLVRRSGRVKVSLARHNFGGAELTELCLSVEWGNWLLAFIRLPAGSGAWAGMGAHAALKLCGLGLTGGTR